MKKKKNNYNILQNLPLQYQPKNNLNNIFNDNVENLEFNQPGKNNAGSSSGGGTTQDLSAYAKLTDLNKKVDKVAGKGLFSGKYEDLTGTPEIPSIDGLATQTYVDNKVSGLVDSAPETLNSLKELANALGDDPNFATTIATQLGNKVDKEEGKGLFSGSYNDLTDTPEIPEAVEVPENVSAFNNDAGYLVASDIANKADKSELFSGSYNDLTDKPEIPEAVEVPENVSAFTNDAGYLVASDIADKADKSELFSGSYNDLTDVPPSVGVPNNVSAFNNDAGYLVASDIEGKADKTELFSGQYSDLTGAPEIPIVPTNVSAFTNDAGYLTASDIDNKVDKVEGKSLVDDTEIERLAEVDNYDDSEIKDTLETKADKTELFSKSYNDLTDTPEIPSIDGLATQTYVDGKVAELVETSSETLETLNKLSAALGDDGDFAVTITNQLATKVDKEEGKGLFSGKYEDLTGAPEIPVVPTNVSAFTNDAGYLVASDIANKADKSELFSGKYTDLTDIPDEVEVPTDVSAFTNDAGYLTASDIDNKVDKEEGKGLFSGKYTDLTEKPEIPSIEGLATEEYVDTKVAGLVDSAPETLDTLKELSTALGDDPNFATTVATNLGNKVDKVEGKSLVDDTEIERLAQVDNYDDAEIKATLETKADKSEIPTVPENVSEFTNDANYLVAGDIANKVDKEEGKGLFSGKYTDLTDTPTDVSTFNNDAGYLTEHQDISGKADKSELFSKSYNDLTDTPEIPVVPENVSAFTNDANYLVASDIDNKVDKEEGKSLVSDEEIERLAEVDNYDDAEIKATLETKADKSELFSGKYTDLTEKPEIPSVEGLATETYVDEKVAGLVDSAPEALNSLKELATALGDDPNFATTVSTKLGNKVDKEEGKGLFSGKYEDLTGAPEIPVVPENVSEFTNDAGYLTEHQDISGKADKTELFSGSYNDLTDTPEIPEAVEVPENVSAFTNDAGYLVASDIANKVDKEEGKGLFSGKYTDLTDVPTDVSTFNNDAGYLTQHQDISGKVDKEVGKSLISDEEIERLAKVDNYDDNEIKATLETKADKSEIPTIPENVSEFTNDAGYLTEHQDISGKVDKEEGKSLVDDTEIERLSQVDNYDDAEIKATLETKADKSNVIEKDNIEVYEPTEDYHPATKKYVDDEILGKVEYELLVDIPAENMEESLNQVDDKTGTIDVDKFEIDPGLYKMVYGNNAAYYTRRESTYKSLTFNETMYTTCEVTYNESKCVIKIQTDNYEYIKNNSIQLFKVNSIKQIDTMSIPKDVIIGNKLQIGGFVNVNDSINSLIVGEGNRASGKQNLVCGEYNETKSSDTFVAGDTNKVTTSFSTVFGSHNTVSDGFAITCFGFQNTAKGNYTFVTGDNNTATGNNSVVEGEGNIASGMYQHVGGKNNIEDTENKYAYIIGNGTSTSNRKNAYTLDWNGNATFAGKVTVNAQPENDNDLASKKYVDEVSMGNVNDTSMKITDKNGHFTADEDGNKKLADVLDQLFQFADNGKKSIASTIGSPLSADDSFSDMDTKIEEMKTALVNTMKDKNARITGEESLKELIDHIAKFAIGFTIGVYPDWYEGDISDQSPDKWITASPLLVESQSGKMVRYNDKIYYIGGYTSTDKRPKNYNYCYDINNNTWSQKADVPISVCEPAVEVCGDYIYCIGGFIYPNATNTNYCYDINNNKWSQKASMPVAKEGAICGCFNNRIYVLCAGALNDKSHYYDPSTDTWTAIGLPLGGAIATYCPGSAIIGDTIYIFGGRLDSAITNMVYYFNPVTYTWGSLAKMPTARFQIGTAAVNNKIYCFGGCTNNQSDTNYINTNECYDVSTNTWTTKADMPISINRTASVSYDNTIYCVGGYNGNSLNTNYCYIASRD